MTSAIYTAIEAMMVDDSKEYADQHNLRQQNALFQHQQFVQMKSATKEAYGTLAKSGGAPIDLAHQLHSMGKMVDSPPPPPPIGKAAASHCSLPPLPSDQ
jgi:hypothetical protein